VDLVPSAEEVEIVESVERFLAQELSLPQLRERMRTGEPVAKQVWKTVADLGIFSLGLEESQGGAGCSVVEEALVFRQLGRHLAPVPFLAGVVGARLAAQSGLPIVRDAICSGEPIAIGSALPGAVVGRNCRGTFRVFDFPGAAWLLLIGEGGELALLSRPSTASDGSSHGVSFVDRESLDPSAQLTDLTLDGIEALALDEEGSQGVLHSIGSILSSALLVGAAEAVRDTSVAYAKDRVQFGRPIGVNQAIKHRCADMAVLCEAACSQLFFAAVALRDGRTDAIFQVGAARRIAMKAAVECTRGNVQVHGGMGYTWEHDAHLYVSRTHALNSLFGEGHVHQKLVLEHAASSL
jgi:alkylation response protein AidB-like acyl-CoA dehydrogenase